MNQHKGIIRTIISRIGNTQSRCKVKGYSRNLRAELLEDRCLLATDLSTVVPNLDFETYNALPTGPNQIFHGQTLAQWDYLPQATPDYMNVDGYMGGGFFGTAPAPTNGTKGFVGVLGRRVDGSAYNEYVVNALPTPLIAGEEYHLDVFAGTTASGGTYGGEFVGELLIYGLLNASSISSYQAQSGSIEQFAANNYVQLLSIPVSQPESMWTSFLDQHFTAPSAIQAIVFGSRTEMFDTYLLIDASALTCPPGDYNNNDIVDAADYVLWRKYLGTSNPLPNDDPSVSPGMVTSEDYAVWRSHFGDVCTIGESSGLSVPEAIEIASTSFNSPRITSTESYDMALISEFNTLQYAILPTRSMRVLRSPLVSSVHEATFALNYGHGRHLIHSRSEGFEDIAEGTALIQSPTEHAGSDLVDGVGEVFNQIGAMELHTLKLLTPHLAT